MRAHIRRAHGPGRLASATSQFIKPRGRSCAGVGCCFQPRRAPPRFVRRGCDRADVHYRVSPNDVLGTVRQADIPAIPCVQLASSESRSPLTRGNESGCGKQEYYCPIWLRCRNLSPSTRFLALTRLACGLSSLAWHCLRPPTSQTICGPSLAEFVRCCALVVRCTVRSAKQSLEGRRLLRVSPGRH